MRLSELPTPCAVVDLDRLERNAAAMRDRARRLGVSLRPHVKTHGCHEAARLQAGGLAGGLTVSTLSEARFFAADGWRDLTWAVPFSAASLPEALELTGSLDRLGLLLDHEAALAELERAAAAKGLVASAWLKVDCGYHRAGVDPARPESARLAARMAGSPHLDFRGLLTHAGQSYACRGRAELVEAVEQERRAVTDFADRLRGDGLEVPEVSIGSTPTMSAAEDLPGVDEIRPGNYVFFDASQVEIGACGPEDAAFFVLTSVTGTAPARQAALVDAGALSLSKDRTASGSHGLVARLDREPLAGWSVASLSQEHGLLSLPEGLEPAWGERLLVTPAHSCLAAACFERYFVVRGDEVVDEWRPVRRR